MTSRFLFFLICIFVSSHNISGQNSIERFSEKSKIGLKNSSTNEILFKADFDEIGWSNNSFSLNQGNIGLKQNEKWALASATGNKITRHYYSALYPFLDSKYIVGLRSNFSILSDFGLIDSRGNEVVRIEYQFISPINESLIVGKKVGQEYIFGMLNKNGKEILPLEYRSISKLDQNTLSIINKKNQAALATTDGQLLSGFVYESLLRYDENTFKIKLKNKEGLINKQGNEIIPSIYKSLEFKNQTAKVLPFSDWTIINNSMQSRIIAHDDVWKLGENTAVQTGDFIGITDMSDSYIFELSSAYFKHSYNELIAYELRNTQGVVNSKGEIILPNSYDSIQFYPKVIFAATKEQNLLTWQPFTLDGKLIGQNQYEEIIPYGELIKAKRNGKLGLLTNDGFEQSPFIFDSIGRFENDLAIAKYQNNFGVIQPNGNWLVTPYKDHIEIIGNRIFYKQGTEYGLLDLSDFLIKRHTNPLVPYHNFYIEKSEKGMILFDINGNQLIESPKDSIFSIGGNFIVLKEKDIFELVDTEKKITFPLAYGIQTIGKWRDGLIAIKKDYEWGFISEQGKLTIANRYQEALDFSEGLAAVKLNGKWGYIDQKEELVIQPNYESATSFQDGLAIANQNGLFGLINKSGEIVLNLEYDSILKRESYFLLKKANLFGIADKEGRLIRSPQFSNLETQDNFHFIVSKENKKGVFTLEGIDILSLIFDQIKQFGSTFAAKESKTWTTLKTN